MMNILTPYHVSRAREAFRHAWRFFHDNAGYCTPPGKAQCALNFAHAERESKSKGFTFDWMMDEIGCLGCDCGGKDCACATGEPHETLCCLCRNEHGKVVASLGAICGATSEYKRVVEAELALEALGG